MLRARCEAPPTALTNLKTLDEELRALRAAAEELRARLGADFIGQERTIEQLVWALFAGGHVLLEGAPGLGKTTLVKSLSEAVVLDFTRLQCTPDLMPSDVLGARILVGEEERGRAGEAFRFERGPIFTHVLLADEVNRATPRTQSALLEAMQEAQVTAYGERHVLEQPFFVVATQNPVEMEGTYPLPEAQLDRFLFKIDLALPAREDLARILGATTGAEKKTAAPALERAQVLRLRALVREVGADSEVLGLVSRIVLATHPRAEGAPESVDDLVRYGSSLRGGQAMLLAGKARALLDGRLFVDAADVLEVAPPALRHRLIPNFEGEATGFDPNAIVADVLDAVR